MKRSRFRFRVGPALAPLSSVLALSFACVLTAPTAHAAGADPAPATEQQLADQAYSLQSNGKYAEAIAVYLKAYELSRDALTLLNIATIYDHKLHERALAVEYYRRYAMAQDAEPDRVKKVTERLTTLKHEEEDAERAQDAVRPAPAPVAPAAPLAATDTHPTSSADDAAQASRGTPMRVAGVVVGVLGLVSVGTSFALGYVAKNKNDDANSVCNGTACTTQSGVDMAKTAGDFATGGTIAFVAGLVLVGGGVVLYAAAPHGPASSKGAGIFLAPRVDRTGAGLALHGAF